MYPLVLCNHVTDASTVHATRVQIKILRTLWSCVTMSLMPRQFMPQEFRSKSYVPFGPVWLCHWCLDSSCHESSDQNLTYPLVLCDYVTDASTVHATRVQIKILCTLWSCVTMSLMPRQFMPQEFRSKSYVPFGPVWLCHWCLDSSCHKSSDQNLTYPLVLCDYVTDASTVHATRVQFKILRTLWSCVTMSLMPRQFMPWEFSSKSYIPFVPVWPCHWCLASSCPGSSVQNLTLWSCVTMSLMPRQFMPRELSSTTASAWSGLPLSQTISLPSRRQPAHIWKYSKTWFYNYFILSRSYSKPD